MGTPPKVLPAGKTPPAPTVTFVWLAAGEAASAVKANVMSSVRFISSSMTRNVAAAERSAASGRTNASRRPRNRDAVLSSTWFTAIVHSDLVDASKRRSDLEGHGVRR